MTLAAIAGWSEQEILSLDSILRMSKNEQRVVEINHNVIHLISLGVYVFSGVCRDGKVAESIIPYASRWTWHHYPAPESRTEARSVNQKWCPAHGTACDPSVDGCGIRDLTSLELCSCKRYHVRDCDVGRRLAEDRVAAEMAEAERREHSLQPAGPAPAYVPPKTKRKKPSKANGWFLPGQTAMQMPGAAPIAVDPANTQKPR